VISRRRRSKKALLPSHGIDRWFDPSIAHSEKAALMQGAVSQHYRESDKLLSSTLAEGWASILTKLFFVGGLTGER
jgi:hypothetical protein